MHKIRAYALYWALTTLLACAAIFAVEQGFVTWGVQKFPDLPAQLAFLLIVCVSVWSYATHGHRIALLLSRNEHAMLKLERGIPSVGDTSSEIEDALLEAASLRRQGAEEGQASFDVLYEFIDLRTEATLTGDIGRIDSIRLLMLFVGLFFTVLAIVSGFASQLFPTNPEEAKLYSFTIIKALGLAYLPAAGCMGSTLVLLVLNNMLEPKADDLMMRFRPFLYKVAVLGASVQASRQSVPARAEDKGGERAKAS